MKRHNVLRKNVLKIYETRESSSLYVEAFLEFTDDVTQNSWVFNFRGPLDVEALNRDFDYVSVSGDARATTHFIYNNWECEWWCLIATTHLLYK